IRNERRRTRVHADAYNFFVLNARPRVVRFRRRGGNEPSEREIRENREREDGKRKRTDAEISNLRFSIFNFRFHHSIDATRRARIFALRNKSAWGQSPA